MKSLAVLLLLAGCAAGLEERAMTCKPPDSDECVRLQELLDRRIQRREARLDCPRGTVAYEDGLTRGCVSRDELWRFMSRGGSGW